MTCRGGILARTEYVRISHHDPIPLLVEEGWRALRAACAQIAHMQSLKVSYFARCRWTRIYFLWRPNLRDESDNHLVELTVAGGAEAVVTRNKRDFRGAELKFENLAVLAPAECLRRKTWQR